MGKLVHPLILSSTKLMVISSSLSFLRSTLNAASVVERSTMHYLVLLKKLLLHLAHFPTSQLDNGQQPITREDCVRGILVTIEGILSTYPAATAW